MLKARILDAESAKKLENSGQIEAAEDDGNRD